MSASITAPESTLKGWESALPSGWSSMRMKHVAQVRLSNVDKKTVEGESRIRLCNYVDVYYHDFITHDMDFMEASASAAQIVRFALRKGDVLITKDSETWDDIAVPACVEADFMDVICGYHLAHLRPNSCLMDGRFLFRAISADGVRDHFRFSANGITRYGISLDDISSAPVPVPPLPEQRAIAAFLDRKTAQIDAVVTKKQRLIERLQEKRQALISHAVTKGLDPHAPMKDSGFEWLKEVPAHWMVRCFRHCGTIPNGQADPRLAEYRDMVLIAPNHIESETGRLIQTETAHDQGAESGKYVAQKGDVIYSKIRPELQKACIAPERCLCSADMYPITPKPDMVAEYILYNLLCDWFTKYAVLWSDRVAMPKVNRETLGNCLMVVPPIDEQHEIVRYIKTQTEHIDRMADRNRQQITKLQEYRQTLISAAVTGKIDVTEEAAC